MSHTFTVKDRNGDPHEYELDLHRGSQGSPIAMRLLALVIEPLAAGAGPALIEAIGAAARQGGLQTKEQFFQLLLTNPEILKSLDLRALSAGLKTALAGITVPFQCQILMFTNRDGQPLVTANGKPSSHFDQAYARNYMELAYALWEVCDVNDFFPVLSTIADALPKASAAAPAPPKSTD